LRAWKRGYTILQFTGGEAFIHKKIFTYILFARKTGFQHISVHSNGLALSDKVFAQKCLDSGIDMFQISIHHYIPEIHDDIV
jgi:MoaA/NifB/PqqE/SkfB family radical SAM enzyme